MIIEIDGRKVEVIYHQKNIKRTYLRLLNNKQIMITSKYNFNEKELTKIIERNLKWLTKKLNLMIDLKENEFLYFGKKYQLQYQNIKDYFFQDDLLIVNEKTGLEKVVAEGLKEVAKEFVLILQKINYHEKPILQFRKMKSKWGVCHINKNKIVLNKAVIHLPLHLIDYIIYHEITHLFHLNHSKAFYQKLASLCPQYQEYRKELRKYYLN